MRNSYLEMKLMMGSTRTVRTLVRTIGVASLTALLCGFSSQGQETAKWTGTWATSPTQDNSGRVFEQQTIRQIIHTSIGGKHFRVHFSNLFGDKPLEIRDVHLSLVDSGSSIRKSSDRQARFNGQTDIVIAPGQTATTDLVDAKFSALSNIAISFYLPGPTGRATIHSTQHQTSYIAAGDVSGAGSFIDPKTTNSDYFLTGLDVEGDGYAGSVVTLGASITEGYISKDSQNHRWPDFLAERLADKGKKIGVLNQGISGNKVLISGSGPSAILRYKRDVLDQPGVRWVIFSDDPINDLAAKQPPTAEQFIAAVQDLIQQAHAAHVKFLCSTLTPFKGEARWSEKTEQIREQFNTFVRSASSGCDAIVDQDAATHDPKDPMRYSPEYDAGDHLHPNEAGHKAIANAVPLSVFQ